jgi:hypothetical protein
VNAAERAADWTRCYEYQLTDDAKLALFKSLKAQGEIAVLKQLIARWVEEPAA